MMEDSFIVYNLLQHLSDKNSFVFLFENYSDAVGQTAVALANCQGGNILVGVGERQRVWNVNDVDGIAAKIQTDFSQILPELPYLINLLPWKGTLVILISIWEGGKKPYMYEEKVYICHNNEIKSANVPEMMSLFDQRAEMDNSWERKPVRLFANEYNQMVMDKVKNKMEEKGLITPNSSTDDLLYKLALLNADVITNAGVVTLAKAPYIYIPQSRIRYSVFSGEQAETAQLSEVRTFEADLFTNVEELTDLITNVYGSNIEFHGTERVEYEVIPRLALREALYNACVHRDYEKDSSFVTVTLHPTKLCISNSGHFLKGIKIEDLDKAHHSILRNPDIANVCYLYGAIEMVGSGTLRIINECKKNHCAIPFWTEKDDVVTITFPEIRHKRVRQSNNSVDLSFLTQNLRRRDELEKIVKYIQLHPHSKTLEIAMSIGKSYPMITRYLQELKEAQVIVYEGSYKTGGWHLMIK